MHETREVEAFLERASAVVKRIKNERTDNAVATAPDFFIFDYLRNNENGLSKCIGLLLSPKGKHAQGDVFLEKFLALIDQKIPERSVIWSNIERKKCVMTLEHATDESRRIDMHLKFNTLEGKGYAIGIESKPWADDGSVQLSHYAQHLKQHNQHSLLIYLSNNDEPDQKSMTRTQREELEKRGEFLILSFRDLNLWLDDCALVVKAPNVKIFIEELKKYIDKEINGKRDMHMNNALADLIVLPENFETAQLLTNALKDAKNKLINKLKDDLSKASKAHQFSLDWSEEKYTKWASGDKYAGFGINFCPNQTFVFELYFEFRGTDLKSFMWGIRRKDETTTLNAEHWAKISKVMKSKYPNYLDQTKGEWKATNWWPWWAYYDLKDNFKRWDTNPEPWMGIIDGSFVRDIILLAVEIDSLFKNNGGKTHLLKCQAE